MCFLIIFALFKPKVPKKRSTTLFQLSPFTLHLIIMQNLHIKYPIFSTSCSFHEKYTVFCIFFAKMFGGFAKKLYLCTVV